ncbi:TRAP transporter large permease subunit, partial [Sulfitobacter mediterraneus]
MLWIGLIVLIFGALALRVNIAAILLVVGAYIHFFWGDAELTYILEDMWSAIDKEVLLSIPLFLLCGSVMGKGAIAERLINVMRALTAP